MKRRVVVNDRMQDGFVYHRTEPIGRRYPCKPLANQIAANHDGAGYATDERRETASQR